MATKRSYQEGCPAAHGLDLIGERWSLLLVRELMAGPRRFTDLRAGLPGISPNVLTQRLNELEDAGIVERRKLPPPAAVWVYDLTEWGAELEPVLVHLGRWALRSPRLPRDVPLGAASMLLALKTLFDPAAARTGAAYALRLGENDYYAQVVDGRLITGTGHIDRAEVAIESDPGTLAAVVHGGQDLDVAVRAGTLRYRGSVSAVRRFLGVFGVRTASAAARAPGTAGSD